MITIKRMIWSTAALSVTAVCFSVALKKSKSDLDAMKKQTEGLTKEYDRLLQEHQEIQVRPTA